MSEDLLKEIAEKCHIEKMREDKKEHEWQDDGNLHYKHGKCTPVYIQKSNILTL